MRRTVLLCLLTLHGFTAAFAETAPAAEDPQTRLERYLEQVFTAMDENYYMPVSRAVFQKFVEVYPAAKLILINEQSKQTEDFVHLGGGLLVSKLKNPNDRFTNLIPPKKIKAFKEEAYAVTVDLGLEGKKSAAGFELTRVQKHSDAYIEEGIRAGDTVVRINSKAAADMTEEEILKALQSELGMRTALEVFFKSSGETRAIELESKSYFKETVFPLATEREGTLALQVAHFNQMTTPDFLEALKAYDMSRIRHLIIDLRDNTGGPPLAARELSAFFTPDKDALFFIVRKNKSPVLLDAPVSADKYNGPITVLVNAKTGSAAETFSGVLQAKKRAEVVGQKTAGGAYLKSIYDFEDGSAIYMVTSRTFFHDRSVFPDDGITPNTLIPDTENALDFVLGRNPAQPR